MLDRDKNTAQFITTADLPMHSRMFMLCLNGEEAGTCTGTIHNLYQKERQSFVGLAEAVLKMDALLDYLECPYADTEKRSFAKLDKKLRNDSEEEREAYYNWLYHGSRFVQQFWQPESFMPGTDGSLVLYVQVRYRQHSSWQGEITWYNSQRKLCFRSVLEFLHLVQSALELWQTDGQLTELAPLEAETKLLG